MVVSQLNMQDYLQTILLWIQSLGAGGAIAFMAIYALATVLFIPGSLLTLGGGAIFGLVFGAIYVFLAATVGATLAFLLGRYLLRGWVAQKIDGNDQFQAIDGAIAAEGLKIVILTRLSPLFPFNLLNYALSLTRVSLKDYILGSIGMLPGVILYVYIGSLAGNLAMIGNQLAIAPQTQRLQWVIRIVGLIATIAVTLFITRLAKRALNESINRSQG